VQRCAMLSRAQGLFGNVRVVARGCEVRSKGVNEIFFKLVVACNHKLRDVYGDWLS
jgi:hypothetical protein